MTVSQIWRMGGGSKVVTLGRGAQEEGPASVKTQTIERKIKKAIIMNDS